MDAIINEPKVLSPEQGKKLVRKNMILLLAGQLVSLFGTNIYGFAIGLYILNETGSGLNFALTIVLSSLPRIFFGPISGVIADRVNRKKMIVSMDIASGLVVLATLLISVITGIQILYLYIAAFLLSVCNTLFTTPLKAETPNLVDDSNITRINSLSHSINSITSIIAPLVGGLVFALIDIKIFLLVNGISFVLSGISEMFIDFEARSKIYGKERVINKENVSFFDSLKETFTYMKTQHWLVAVMLLAISGNLLMTLGVSVPVPYIAKVVWGFNESLFGILNTGIPIGMLIGALVLSALPEAPKNYKRIVGSVTLCGTVMLAIGLLVSPVFEFSNIVYLVIMMIFYFLMAGSLMALNIPVMVIIQKRIPNEKLGRIMGVFSSMVVVATPIGAIVGGALVDQVPLYVLPVVGGILLIATILVTQGVKGFKEL